MFKEEIFNKIKGSLAAKLQLPEDKPEETIDSNLKALWFAAAGQPKSAEKAAGLPLPDITEQQVKVFHQLVEKRLNNTPLAYITGRQCFMDIELLADNRALIPRKETEILGRKAVDVCTRAALLKQEVNVIDVCCGAGNLALALAHYNPTTIVNASDLSQEAVDLTQENIAKLNFGHRVQVTQGDLFSAFETGSFYGKADLIVCNPPYISSAKVGKIHAEISANEPTLAFDGGMLGINLIQNLIREAAKFLTKTGWLLFEVGVGQGGFIMNICENMQEYDKIESVSDNLGNIRVICARKK